jgi:hypothetical protein
MLADSSQRQRRLVASRSGDIMAEDLVFQGPV